MQKMKTNEFLYLFDLMDFDINGKVCASKSVDLPHAQSNFLYLICKYNQMILKTLQQPMPIFFKEKLSNLLSQLENGEVSFEKAKHEVLSECHKSVQEMSAQNDKTLILKLREFVSLDKVASCDKNVNKFVSDLHTVENVLEKENKLTRESGKKFNNIIQMISKANVEGANE